MPFNHFSDGEGNNQMVDRAITDNDLGYKDYHLELKCFSCGVILKINLNSKQQLYSPRMLERQMEFHDWQHLQNKEVCPFCVQKAIDYLLKENQK